MLQLNTYTEDRMKNPEDAIEQRLCCTDGPCFRNEVIFHFESEWDDYVHPEMKWGPQDLFMRHKDHVYYYKPRMQSIFDADMANLAEDEQNPERMEAMTAVNTFLGYEFAKTRTSMDFIKQLIKSKPAGLPTYVAQSTNFFKFRDVGDEKFSIDNIDRDLLDRIKNTFTGDYNPLLCDMTDGLYLKDGQLYFTDITRWSHNPHGKLGVFVNPTESEIYDNAADKAFFFPFEQLTDEQVAFVKALGKLETDYQEDIEIIYL